MKKNLLWMMAAIMTICGATTAEAETLRGTVKDAITGEPLVGATVKIVELQNAAAVADINGNSRPYHQLQDQKEEGEPHHRLRRFEHLRH